MILCTLASYLFSPPLQYTPLHVAASKGRDEIVNFFIEKGAKDSKGARKGQRKDVYMMPLVEKDIPEDLNLKM